MGIIKRAGDLVYTFRFLRLLTTDFKDTEAYKLGIIDENGKRLKSYSMDTIQNRDSYKEYYTPFHRLVFNIKKLMAAAPGGGSKLASYAAALYLIKEKYSITNNQINEALKISGIDKLDFLSEDSKWFLLDDGRLSPGYYKVQSDKLINTTLEEMVRSGDRVLVSESCYPVGEILGLDVYEVTHSRTKQPVYVTVGELAR